MPEALRKWLKILRMSYVRTGYNVKSAVGRADDLIVVFRVIRIDTNGDVTI